MCSIEQNPMFPYTEEDKRVVWKEFNLTENFLHEAVDAVIDWFEKQPHLVDAGIDKALVEKMIIISKGSIEKAKRKIDSFYKYRCLAPEIIQGREILCKPQRKLWDVCPMVPVAKMQNGIRIHFLKFAPDIIDFDIAYLFKMGFMYVDIRMRYDYWAGDIWILDMKHVTPSFIFHLRPNILRKAALLFQNGLNWRIQAIHIVNLDAPTSLVQRVLDIFNQFFSSLIMSRVIIHETVEHMYQYLPKECLPEDYGGNSPSTLVLIDEMEK